MEVAATAQEPGGACPEAPGAGDSARAQVQKAHSHGQPLCAKLEILHPFPFSTTLLGNLQKITTVCSKAMEASTQAKQHAKKENKQPLTCKEGLLPREPDLKDPSGGRCSPGMARWPMFPRPGSSIIPSRVLREFIRCRVHRPRECTKKLQQ